jgi:hypothetical protein
MGAVGEADRRPDRPAVRRDLLRDDRIAIIGLGEKTAEFLLGIIDKYWKQKLALVGGDQRPVIGDKFGA